MRILIITILLLSQKLTAQIPLTWEELADVEYSYTQEEKTNEWSDKPTFGPKARAVEGKKVYITGYVIPIDISGELLVLSEYPFSSCFFCGGAGKESVIELQIRKNKRNFRADERVSFMGVLRLSEDPYDLSYILENVIVYE